MTLRLEVSLYVSCDARACEFRGRVVEFNGATQEECAVKLREAGWVWVVEHWDSPVTVLCPACVKEGRVAAQDANEVRG